MQPPRDGADRPPEKSRNSRQARSEGLVQRRAFLAGSALSGLMRTLTVGLGAFFVGPSLIALHDDVGRWATIAALAVATSAALFILMRHSYRHQ